MINIFCDSEHKSILEAADMDPKLGWNLLQSSYTFKDLGDLSSKLLQMFANIDDPVTDYIVNTRKLLSQIELVVGNRELNCKCQPYLTIAELGAVGLTGCLEKKPEMESFIKSKNYLSLLISNLWLNKQQLLISVKTEKPYCLQNC